MSAACQRCDLSPQILDLDDHLGRRVIPLPALLLHQVKGEQPCEDLLVGDVLRPAVGVEHSGIELLVREIQPGRAPIVEI
jgi:hypothetical protein